MSAHAFDLGSLGQASIEILAEDLYPLLSVKTPLGNIVIGGARGPDFIPQMAEFLKGNAPASLSPGGIFHLDFYLEEKDDLCFVIDFDYGDDGWSGEFRIPTTKAELEACGQRLEDLTPQILAAGERAHKAWLAESDKRRLESLQEQVSQLEEKINRVES